MLSQLRASFQPKLSLLSEPEKLTRESDQLPIPNITESNVSPSANHHEQRGPHTDHVSFQLSPTSLSQNLSPTSMTHSSLSLASPALHSSTTSIRPVISPSSSTHPSPVKPTMPAEMFIIVRPPPGKQNHPLNLQVQLILPNQNVMSREPSTSTTNGLPGNSSPSHSQIFSGRPISSAPETIDGSTDHSLQLKRTQSIRSIHSSRSSRSHRTCSSGSESRNRRVTPLYNLQWHTVLPTWISDAGTDAKVAKFAKKGLELIDLANIEPSEIRSGRYPSDLNLLLNGGPISPPSHVAIPHSNASGGTANSNPNQKTDRPAAAALFNKVRKLGVFNKKGGSKMEAGLTANPAAKKVAGTRNSDQFTHNDLPSTNGGLSTVGPLIEAGGRRATGYAWIVRKWNKPEIVDWQNSAPKTNQISPVLVEWRKAKKRARVPPKTKSHPERSSSNPSHTVAPPPPDPTPVTAPSAQAVPEDPSPPEPHAPDSALKLFTIPAAVTTIGVMNFLGRFTKAVEPSPAPEPSPEEAPEPLRATAEQTPKPSRTTTLESSTSVVSHPSTGQQEEEEESRLSSDAEEEEETCPDSDPEDSESPWECEVVVVGGVSGRQQERSTVASLTPHPHHPKLVAQLAVPWNLEPVLLRPLSAPPLDHTDEEHEDQLLNLSVEELKDLIAVTALWLVVKERLGGVGKRRKGDRAWRI